MLYVSQLEMRDSVVEDSAYFLLSAQYDGKLCW